MATQDVRPPTPGGQGEPCAACGTPLAPDQRYCLACGARRAVVASSPPPAAPPPAASASPAPSTLSFLAAVGCLLLALGVGVLIGRSGGSDAVTATTPAPQIIRVAAPAAATAAAPAATTPAKAAATSSKARRAARAKAAAKAPTVTKKDLQGLDKLSPQEYQKRSKKLPKQVVTQGRPPKVDKSKPAGGGTGFQDIG